MDDLWVKTPLVRGCTFLGGVQKTTKKLYLIFLGFPLHKDTSLAMLEFLFLSNKFLKKTFLIIYQLMLPQSSNLPTTIKWAINHKNRSTLKECNFFESQSTKVITSWIYCGALPQKLFFSCCVNAKYNLNKWSQNELGLTLLHDSEFDIWLSLPLRPL